MKNIFALLVSLALVIPAFAMTPAISDISQNELQSAIASKSVVLLDANGSDSYREGHIPGAIDYFAHKAEIAKLLPTDKNTLVVAYCRDVHCAAYKQAATAALNLGYTNVKHFPLGIEGWKSSGAPTEKS